MVLRALGAGLAGWWWFGCSLYQCGSFSCHWNWFAVEPGCCSRGFLATGDPV